MKSSNDDQVTTIDVSGQGGDYSNMSTITSECTNSEGATHSNSTATTTTTTTTKFVLRGYLHSGKNAKKNSVWEYYDHFDLTYHPDKRNYRCCLICRECGIDKAISVGKAASTGPLVNHL